MNKERDLLESAWTIIANVDWPAQSPLWRKAAEMWRDKYHDCLREHKENYEMPVCDEPIELKRW